MRNILAFDIETIPDIEGRKRLYGLDRLSGPVLVSRNGGGFDLPLLCHRSFIQGVRAPSNPS
jgi:predicted PolB exonuclease-like 3'-5' exonuclease